MYFIGYFVYVMQLKDLKNYLLKTLVFVNYILVGW